MMRRTSDIKDAIARLRKLKALQVKATGKLNKIGENAAARAPKKKKSQPAVLHKAKAPVKKVSFWKKLTGKKRRTQKISQPLKTKNKKPGKKGPGSSPPGNNGFIFRHFGRGRG
jgi:hypothetical protein